MLCSIVYLLIIVKSSIRHPWPELSQQLDYRSLWKKTTKSCALMPLDVYILQTYLYHECCPQKCIHFLSSALFQMLSTGERLTEADLPSPLLPAVPTLHLCFPLLFPSLFSRTIVLLPLSKQVFHLC